MIKVSFDGCGKQYFRYMETRLIFSSYADLAGFLSVADNGNIELNLHTKTLTAAFNQQDIQKALQGFNATLTPP